MKTHTWILLYVTLGLLTLQNGLFAAEFDHGLTKKHNQRDISGQYHPEGTHHAHAHLHDPSLADHKHTDHEHVHDHDHELAEESDTQFIYDDKIAPVCSCVEIGRCGGKEEDRVTEEILRETPTTLVCGLKFQQCCKRDYYENGKPWPGVVDRYLDLAPCVAEEVCRRHYGTQATDIRDYGIIPHCPGYGSIRCLDGFVLKDDASLVVPDGLQTVITEGGGVNVQTTAIVQPQPQPVVPVPVVETPAIIQPQPQPEPEVPFIEETEAQIEPVAPAEPEPLPPVNLVRQPVCIKQQQCRRQYGVEPTDVRDYGTFSNCEQFGYVRCLDDFRITYPEQPEPIHIVIPIIEKVEPQPQPFVPDETDIPRTSYGVPQVPYFYTPPTPYPTTTPPPPPPPPSTTTPRPNPPTTYNYPPPPTPRPPPPPHHTPRPPTSYLPPRPSYTPPSPGYNPPIEVDDEEPTILEEPIVPVAEIPRPRPRPPYYYNPYRTYRYRYGSPYGFSFHLHGSKHFTKYF